MTNHDKLCEILMHADILNEYFLHLCIDIREGRKCDDMLGLLQSEIATITKLAE